jgi:hypothetical protein
MKRDGRMGVVADNWICVGRSSCRGTKAKSVIHFDRVVNGFTV